MLGRARQTWVNIDAHSVPSLLQSIWIYISLWRTNNLEESSSLPSLPAGPTECLFNVSLSLHSVLVISVQSKPHCGCISCMFFQYNRWIINSPIKQNTRQCLLSGTTFCPDRGKHSSTHFALTLYLQHTNSAEGAFANCWDSLSSIHFIPQPLICWFHFTLGRQPWSLCRAQKQSFRLENKSYSVSSCVGK